MRGGLQFAFVDVFAELFAQTCNLCAYACIVHVVVERHAETAKDGRINLCGEFHILTGMPAYHITDRLPDVFAHFGSCYKVGENNILCFAVELYESVGNTLQVDAPSFAHNKGEKKSADLRNPAGEDIVKNGDFLAFAYHRIGKYRAKDVVLDTNLVDQPHIVAHCIKLPRVRSDKKKGFCVVEIYSVVFHLIKVGD